MDVGEQFSLCWNNFHTNLSSGFHNLLQDEDLVDVTLAAEGKYVKAHKTVLSVCSPFFKELFRVNPCKHPIVILPDVSYSALRSLLHFMYQGEVSVGQEEIHMFMKVAETLKVKGLTDNADTPNGFPAKVPLMTVNRHDITKRPRPAKKLIRPIQPLRPLETARLSPRAAPSSNKRPHLDQDYLVHSDGSNHSLEMQQNQVPQLPEQQNEALSLIKLKEEPVEAAEGRSRTNTGSSADFHPDGTNEMQMELANMLDTQLSGGEPSPSHQAPPWPSPSEMTPVIGPDESSTQPGTLQLVLGRRGNPRLLIDGHAFLKKSVYKGKAFWYCKNSRLPLKCPSVAWTLNGDIIKWPSAHNHVLFPDIFNPDEDSEIPIESLQEVLRQSSLSN